MIADLCAGDCETALDAALPVVERVAVHDRTNAP